MLGGPSFIELQLYYDITTSICLALVILNEDVAN